MNTSSGIWDIPPPPGTEDEDPVSDSSKMNMHSSRAIDRIDPYLKNPQYLEYEKKSVRHNRRSRSHSYDRFEKRRHSRSRSRSKSRHRYRRSRSSSKSRSHRRKNHTKSRSRSQSKSVSKHSRRNKDRKSRHSSRSRNSSRSRQSSRSKYSRSRSRSESRSKSHRSHKTNKFRRTSKEHSDFEEKPTSVDVNHDVIDMKVEEEDETEQDSTKDNAFKNDGSFLEMFKKMQEEKLAQEEAQKADAEKQKSLPAFGKRRGGRVLKTGMVLKTKPQDSEESAHDPWSVYMKEVKRYKEACCDDDSKTRPLVK